MKGRANRRERRRFSVRGCEGQVAGELFGVGFEASDEGGVPVEKDETEEGASRESDEMPLLRVSEPRKQRA